MDRSRRGTDRAGAASAGPPPPRGGVGKQQPRRVRPQTSRPREASAAQQNAVLAPRRPAPLKLVRHDEFPAAHASDGIYSGADDAFLDTAFISGLLSPSELRALMGNVESTEDDCSSVPQSPNGRGGAAPAHSTDAVAEDADEAGGPLLACVAHGRAANAAGAVARELLRRGGLARPPARTTARPT